MSQQQKAFVVGISGVSSSGKTTLARQLRDTWPQTSILHEDDFYFVDEMIPVKNGVQDWDCVEAIDIDKFQTALTFIKTHGTLPPDLESKEDLNSVGEIHVDTKLIQQEKHRIHHLLGDRSPMPIIIVDGFLLYSESVFDYDQQDQALVRQAQPRFVCSDTYSSYATAKARREARTGYVTIEGFWEDPPGYVDNIVWPNYVKDHAFLFVDGNVEGAIDSEVCNRMSIKVVPDDAQHNMTKCHLWASRVLSETYATR